MAKTDAGEWITTAEAARRMKVSTKQARELLIRDMPTDVKKVGKRYHIRAAAFDEYVRSPQQRDGNVDVSTNASPDSVDDGSGAAESIDDVDTSPVPVVQDEDQSSTAEIPAVDSVAEQGDSSSARFISDDEYFADDEQMLAGDDLILHDKGDLSVIEQLDGVVSWQIHGIYDKKGALKSRRAVRVDPPILEITSSDGQSAQFVLTEYAAASLLDALNDVKKSYSGGRSTRERAIARRQRDIVSAGENDTTHSSNNNREGFGRISQRAIVHSVDKIRAWVLSHKWRATVVGALVVSIVVLMIWT